MKFETSLLHADDTVPVSTTDVSAAIHVSTTYENIPVTSLNTKERKSKKETKEKEKSLIEVYPTG